MAQVPYSPVPQATLSSQGLPESSPNIPAAAFGGDIATAISGMGKEVAGAGNELYERAVWLQNLNNQAEAKRADAQYTTAAGEEHIRFASLSGDAAVKAYPEHAKRLKEIRASIGGGLSTAMSQRMYEADSGNVLARSILSGAQHAAVAQKEFVNGAIDAKIKANINQTALYPTDSSATDSGLKENERLIRERGRLNGKAREVIDNEVAETASKLWSAKIQEMAKTEPFQAQKMFDENKGKLWYQDAQATETVLRSQRYGTGARMIAQELTKDLYDNTPGKPPERGLEERVTEARAKAEKMYPDDPDFAFQTEQQVRSLYTRRKTDIRDTQISNENTLTAGVIGEYGGKIPTTVEELKGLDPELAKSWDTLPATKKRKYLTALANNAKGDYAPDEKNYREYMKLRGQAISDNAEDRDAFMNTDIVGLELPMKWRSALNKQRESMLKSAGGDVEVSKALRQLTDAGIAPDRTDKDATKIYRGALQEAISEFTEKNNRKPKLEELKQIGSQLISQTVDPERWTFWGVRSGTVPFYQLSVPDEEKTKIKEAYGKDGINEPTDEQIQRVYLRKQYIKLYGGTVKQGVQIPIGTTSSKGTSPSVTVSE